MTRDKAINKYKLLDYCLGLWAPDNSIAYSLKVILIGVCLIQLHVVTNSLSETVQTCISSTVKEESF